MSTPRIDDAPVSFIPKTPQEAFKAILTILVTLFAAIRASVSDGVFSPAEGLQLVIMAATILPVFIFGGTLPKAIAAFVLAALQFLMPAVTVLAGWDSWSAITFDDYAGAILAAMLAIGIAVIPNAPAPNDTPREVVVVNEAAPTPQPSFSPARTTPHVPDVGSGA